MSKLKVGDRVEYTGYGRAGGRIGTVQSISVYDPEVQVSVTWDNGARTYDTPLVKNLRKLNREPSKAKVGDIVQARAFWPQTIGLGDEFVTGTLVDPKDGLPARPGGAWVKSSNGELRLVVKDSIIVLASPQRPRLAPETTVRASVLDEAKRITATDRNSSYGEPEDNFKRIADLWNVYLQDKLSINLSPADTAALMILVKVAREMNAPTRDNKVDIAGYAACWAEVDSKEKPRGI